MKKIFMFLALTGCVTISFAQSLGDIDKLLALQKNKEAKAAIDKLSADPASASKPDVWFYKGKIYNINSMDAATSNPDQFALKSASFDAFKQYQVLDNKDVRMKIEEYKPYLQLYLSLYDLGAAQFNAKDFPASFATFEKALEVKNYITSKNYVYTELAIPVLDTSLVLNTAIAAGQAKNMDAAMRYYKQITDANVGGATYQQIYEILADSYLKSKDEPSFNAIIVKARNLYPTNDIWDDLELRLVSSEGDKAPLYAKYETLMALKPNNFGLAYNYAVEYYNSIYGKDEKPKDIPAAQAKLTDVLNKAIANDTGIEATVLMTNHLYNIAADLSGAATMIKGTKPDDVKKRADLKAKANKAMDEVIVPANKVLAFYSSKKELKGIEKANQKITSGYLVDIYELKGDTKKSAEYAKMRDAY